MASLSEADNGGRIELRVGDTLTIRLSEAAGGGYHWAPDRLDTALLQLENITREASFITDSVGSSVDAVVVLKACGAGTTDLILKHWRQWEGEDSVVDRFCVTVTIDS